MLAVKSMIRPQGVPECRLFQPARALPGRLRFRLIVMGTEMGENPRRRGSGGADKKGRTLRAAVIAGLSVAALAAGGSYAAWVPRNSVGSKQIKKGAVISPKIRTGAVRRSEIATGAVAAPEIAAGALPRAYALIEGWPNVGIAEDSSQRMAGATATLGDEGYVCLDDLDFKPLNVQTTLLGTGQNAVNSILNTTIAATTDVSQCPGGEDASFVAIDASSGVIDPTPPGFFVTLYD